MKIRSILLIVITSVLCSCKDNEDDVKNEDGSVPLYSLAILSPTPDSTFSLGEVVELSIEVRSSEGGTVGLDQATWETGDWLAIGNNLSVSDLPEGSRSLSVTADAAGETFIDFVDIHIGDEDGGDTGDTGGGEGNFEGVIEAQILLQLDASSGGTTYDDPCEGWADFSIVEGVLAGTGSCRAFGEDWDFDIEGTDEDGVLTGSLAMKFEEAEPEATPFTGTRDELDHVLIDFNGTHYPGEVSGVAIEYLNISGTITADPDLD